MKQGLTYNIYNDNLSSITPNHRRLVFPSSGIEHTFVALRNIPEITPSTPETDIIIREATGGSSIFALLVIAYVMRRKLLRWFNCGWTQETLKTSLSTRRTPDTLAIFEGVGVQRKHSIRKYTVANTPNLCLHGRATVYNWTRYSRRH